MATHSRRIEKADVVTLYLLTSSIAFKAGAGGDEAGARVVSHI